MNPSFNQKSLQVALVTRLPDHECASSCATSETRTCPRRAPSASRTSGAGSPCRRRGSSAAGPGGRTRPSDTDRRALGRLHHRLGVGEFPGRRLATTEARRRRRCRGPSAEREVADRQGHQIRRDALRHLEAVDAVRVGPVEWSALITATSPGLGSSRRRSGAPTACPGAGSRAGVDRLGLREEERMLLPAVRGRSSHCTAAASGEVW